MLFPPVVLCFLFFFFQAEDGIRDHCVTGVQTCALPISPACATPAPDSPWRARRIRRRGSAGRRTPRDNPPARREARCRSEERRVGKEATAGGRPNFTENKKHHWRPTSAARQPGASAEID